jgi:hypothetical protein
MVQWKCPGLRKCKVVMIHKKTQTPAGETLVVRVTENVQNHAILPAMPMKMACAAS